MSPPSKKPALKLGDKVRFVGPAVINDGSNTPFWNRMDQTGVVKEQIGDIVIFGNDAEIHRRQVTHVLKPRPKAEPARVERWLAGDCPYQCSPNRQEAEQHRKQFEWKDPVKRLVEVREGEAIVERAALADLICDTLNEDPGLLVGTIEKWKALLANLRKDIP